MVGGSVLTATKDVGVLKRFQNLFFTAANGVGGLLMFGVSVLTATKGVGNV